MGFPGMMGGMGFPGMMGGMGGVGFPGMMGGMGYPGMMGGNMMSMQQQLMDNGSRMQELAAMNLVNQAGYGMGYNQNMYMNGYGYAPYYGMGAMSSMYPGMYSSPYGNMYGSGMPGIYAGINLPLPSFNFNASLGGGMGNYYNYGSYGNYGGCGYYAAGIPCY
jgi:hypothetical protein